MIMDALHGYPFLKAALDDVALLSEILTRNLGSARHAVCLMHDSLEFILYESLLALDQDIYRNGQNTIGLDAAISLCKTCGIDLPLLGTIRAIQKHRGDAKHHAQTPYEAAFSKMSAEFRIIVSRSIHERFGQVLGAEMGKLGLLPYHVALYESYRKYRTHNWGLALRFGLGALLHKHRAILEAPEDFLGGTNRDPEVLFETFTREVTTTPYPPAPSEALASLKNLPSEIRELLGSQRIPEAAEVAGRGYARVDAILPGIFDIRSAHKITERLVQPEFLSIRRAMFWSKWQHLDTQRKQEVEAKLHALLKRTPDLVKIFGQPYYGEDDSKYWRWWEFAVLDGAKWHTFHLNDNFGLSLESGSLSDEDARRREEVAELILEEFERAAKRFEP
jgi:hypothetical protein